MALRRARGVLLRLVRHRALAMAVGVVIAAPAAWIELAGPDVAWWIRGLCYVLGATGVAFFWTGLSGNQPDWVEPSERREGS